MVRARGGWGGREGGTEGGRVGGWVGVWVKGGVFGCDRKREKAFLV